MSALSAVASITRALLLLAAITLGVIAAPAHTQAAAPSEDEVKAGFVFNFSHFVGWPAESFVTPTEPFVIGVLGGEALAAELEEAVRDERLDTHPLVVQRLHSPEGIPDCRILYIDRSLGAEIDRILAQLQPRGTLTVSDFEGAALHGVAIEMTSDSNRVRLVINADSAHEAGLTISSSLLRLAASD